MHRIVLFTDSKWRDLPSSVAIKHNIEQLSNDYEVKVVSYHLWQDILNYYNPHLVVLNHIQGNRNKTIASQIRRNGGLAVVQFNEGIIEFDGKADIFIEQRGHTDISSFLCWNKATAKLVNGIDVGCPRFDIYGDYKHVIDPPELFRDKFNIPHDKQIILWNDSWPSAKFTYSLQSFHKSNWSDLKNTVADKWASADEFAQEQFAQQELFKRYITEAKYNFPEVHMVVKSHPMSDYRMWDNWGREHDITIIHGEYIFNALNAADLVVTKLGSMTVAESWIMKKTAIKLGSDYFTASSKEQFDADPWNADNMHLVMSTIDSFLSYENDNFNTTQRKYLKKWGIFPKQASVKTAEIIMQSVKNDTEKLRGDYRPIDFERAILAHDRKYMYDKLDGYGNWDKAIVQEDVKHLLQKIDDSNIT